MPLYEYACRSCSARFEELRKFDERLNAPACPQCGGKETVLRLSAPGFVGAGVSPGPAAGGCDYGVCGTGHAHSGGCCGGGACGLN